MVKRALLTIFLAIAGLSFAYAEDLGPAEVLSVPAGTMLHCRTTETLTTKLNSQGDSFTMTLTEPVAINNTVVIPSGALLAGHITRMERPGRVMGVGEMRLSVEQITLPSGRSLPIGAILMTAYGVDHIKVVGSEGLIKGPSSRFQDFEEIGGGTAGGVLVGLIFAHPIVGATVGLTATTVDRLRRRGKDLTIPAGTQLNYQLTRELSLASTTPHTSDADPAHGSGK